jgi:hypothetical protein
MRGQTHPVLSLFEIERAKTKLIGKTLDMTAAPPDYDKMSVDAGRIKGVAGQERIPIGIRQERCTAPAYPNTGSDDRPPAETVLVMPEETGVRVSTNADGETGKGKSMEWRFRIERRGGKFSGRGNNRSKPAHIKMQFPVLPEEASTEGWRSLRWLVPVCEWLGNIH